MCETLQKFGASEDECARLNASLTCLRSAHKSGEQPRVVCQDSNILIYCIRNELGYNIQVFFTEVGLLRACLFYLCLGEFNSRVALRQLFVFLGYFVYDIVCLKRVTPGG